MDIRKSRLSQSKQDRLIEHFVAGTTARCASDLVGVNFKTAAYFYHRLREIICLATGEETPFTGEIEVDESYFGCTRKGKRGRGAAGEVERSALKKYPQGTREILRLRGAFSPFAQDDHKVIWNDAKRYPIRPEYHVERWCCSFPKAAQALPILE